MLQFTLQVNTSLPEEQRNHLPSLEASDTASICPINMAFLIASAFGLSIPANMDNPSEVAVEVHH